MLADLRYALRQLIENRGFAAVAISTLALGVGAGTASRRATRVNPIEALRAE